MTPAPLILIVGMHRSGTSLLGNLLHAAGVAMPGPLIAGDLHNPEGYFERADITDLQEQLLIALDRWWPSEQGTQPLPPDWLCRPATHAALNRLHGLLVQESGQQQGPWAIKDPRSSLLLPLWRPLCAALGIPLRVVLAVRDPREVVASLCQRDALPAGMTAERAEAIWRHHNHTVLRQAAGLPLLLVDYGLWFSGPDQASEQLQRVLTFCGMSSVNHAADHLKHALTLIKPQHRRSRDRAGAVTLQESSLAIYGALANGDAVQAMAWFATTAQPSPQSTALQLQSGSSPGKRARLRAYLWAWRSRRAAQNPGAAPLIEPGAWFDTNHYRGQWPGMAACSRSALLHHYRTAGWLAGSSPHRFFDPEHYQQACAQAGLSLQGNPLDHWLSAGQLHNLTPSPLADASWLQQQPSDGRNLTTLSAHLHPWGIAAEAVTAEPEAAVGLLASWLERGQLNPEALTALAALPTDPLPGGSAAAKATDTLPPANPERPWRAAILGSSWHNWQAHALLQHLPWPLDPEQALWCEGWPTSSTTEAEANGETLALLVLHLQPLELTNQQGLLPALVGQLVFDMRPEQVQLLRRLGVNAHTIAAAAPLRHPLPAASAAEASSSLGLPSPAALATSCAPGVPAPLCLGSTGPLWERSLDRSCWCLPAFHSQATTSATEARHLAAWLQACQLAGVQLVELAAPTGSVPFDGFAALAQPVPRPAGWLPVQRFQSEITPAELHAELAWRRQGCPAQPPCPTPAPASVGLWQHQHAAPTAAVCVSLHNYADRITSALESVHRQTHAPLELIVVDDASSDTGAAVVHTWLEQHGHRFARALLLQHTSNGGLASARNTAFQTAEAPWCFVLDADNALHPEAVERCLAIAQAAPATTAVVHPLIHRVSDDLSRMEGVPTNAPLGLLSDRSWQQHSFHHGNYVDAMALVRRSAWQAVGGYTHIPGGWEDYDFWCKLMDAGLQGVLCPQPLAKYIMHGSSMTASTTARSQRPLSRWLQQRHPWLELPMALEAPPHPDHRQAQTSP